MILDKKVCQDGGANTFLLSNKSFDYTTFLEVARVEESKVAHSQSSDRLRFDC